MALCIPSTAALHALASRAIAGDPDALANAQRLDDQALAQSLEDYRTISSDRGPVRGYPGGLVRR